MTVQAKRVCLIAAERGGHWAPWVERFRRRTPDVVVVLQQIGEKLSQFALRVRGRVTELEREGVCVEQAVLVGGGRTDSDALAARSLAIRAMAAGMARHGGGNVVLEDAGADRHSMAALAATVAPLVYGTGVSITHGAPSAPQRPRTPAPARIAPPPLAHVA